jgi:hypothetical protein
MEPQKSHSAGCGLDALPFVGTGIAAISSVFPAENGQAAASKSNLRWLQVLDLNLALDKFRSLAGRIGGNITD